MRAGVELCRDILFSIECIEQHLGSPVVRGFTYFMQKEQDAASYRLLISDDCRAAPRARESSCRD
jgi:hypothetical protein